MSKISVRTVCIASLAFILLISVFPLIQVLKGESRGVIDRGKYHEEIQGDRPKTFKKSLNSFHCRSFISDNR